MWACAPVQACLSVHTHTHMCVCVGVCVCLSLCVFKCGWMVVCV